MLGLQASEEMYKASQEFGNNTDGGSDSQF